MTHSNSDKGLVIILGMHRSGTSVVTHILSKAGFFVGEDHDVMLGDQWNLDGYFERLSVVLVNDIILYLAGGAWDSPPEEKHIHGIRLDPKIESLLEIYEGHEQAVIKDPRMCLTLPVWQYVLGEDNIRIVNVTRQPSKVAESLMKRDGFPEEKSLSLYNIYTERASNYMRDYAVFALQYEDLLSNRRPAVLEKLANFLEINRNLESIAIEIIDPFIRRTKNNKVVLSNYDEKQNESQDKYRSGEELNCTGSSVMSPGKSECTFASQLEYVIAHNDLGLLSWLYNVQIGKLKDKEKQLKAILNSKSWKITRPLRLVGKKFFNK